MIGLGRSKTGLPTLTENGGGMSNTGRATLICGPNGEKLKPLYVPRRGHSNSDHAIFAVKPGTHIVFALHHRGGEYISVAKITGIADGDLGETELIGEYENGDGNIPPQFHAVANAALAKARCYHCREPHWVKEKE